MLLFIFPRYSSSALSVDKNPSTLGVYCSIYSIVSCSSRLFNNARILNLNLCSNLVYRRYSLLFVWLKSHKSRGKVWKKKGCLQEHRSGLSSEPLYITKGRGGGRKRLIIQLIFTVQPDNAAELLLVYTVFSFCVSKTHTRLTFNKNPNNTEPPEPRETAATGAGEETVDVKTNGKSLFSAF